MKQLLLLLTAAFALSSFSAKTTRSDGYYAILVIDGVHKDGTGYASRIIYYPGYSDCKKYASHAYFNEATRSFGDYLKAQYNSVFPYGEGSNIREINTRQFSTSELLKTRAQAEQRLTEWVAEQKDKGYKVEYTNFGFSCDNL